MQRKKNETVQYNGITEGVIWQQLLIFFFPILFGTFFQQLYNTADAMIVGKFVGKEALSAVGGTTGNLINLLVGFFVGLSSGAAVIVSQHYGARQDDQVRTSVHTSFCLALAGGVFLMIVGEACARVAVKAMGAPEEIMDYSVTYMRIYFLGVIPNLVYNMGAAILRAVGDSRRPLYYLIVCCFVNIGLDLLFVVVLKMEVAGAALATILSQLLSAALVMWTLMRTKESFRFELKHLKVDKPMLRKIIQIGFPAGLQSVLYSISNVVIQANINSFGTNVIGGLGRLRQGGRTVLDDHGRHGHRHYHLCRPELWSAQIRADAEGPLRGSGDHHDPDGHPGRRRHAFWQHPGVAFYQRSGRAGGKYDHHPVRNAVLVQLYLCKRIFQYPPGHRRHVYPHAADLLRAPAA